MRMKYIMEIVKIQSLLIRIFTTPYWREITDLWGKWGRSFHCPSSEDCLAHEGPEHRPWKWLRHHSKHLLISFCFLNLLLLLLLYLLFCSCCCWLTFAIAISMLPRLGTWFLFSFHRKRHIISYVRWQSKENLFFFLLCLLLQAVKGFQLCIKWSKTVRGPTQVGWIPRRILILRRPLISSGFYDVLPQFLGSNLWFICECLSWVFWSYHP